MISTMVTSIDRNSVIIRIITIPNTAVSIDPPTRSRMHSVRAKAP